MPKQVNSLKTLALMPSSDLGQRLRAVAKLGELIHNPKSSIKASGALSAISLANTENRVRTAAFNVLLRVASTDKEAAPQIAQISDAHEEVKAAAQLFHTMALTDHCPQSKIRGVLLLKLLAEQGSNTTRAQALTLLSHIGEEGDETTRTVAHIVLKKTLE